MLKYLRMFKFDKYDAVLITDEKQMFYFTGFSASAGYLLFTSQGNYYVTDMRYFSALERHLTGTDFKAVIGNDFSFLADLAKTIGIKKLGVDYNCVTLEKSVVIRKACSSLADVSKEIEDLMLIKRQSEIDKIAKACQITEQTFLEVLPKIKLGMTELELQAEIIYGFLKRGAQSVSFEPIVAFGANGAVPHHKTGDAKLKANTSILMDIGCVYKGYCSDFTRTVFFGKPDALFLNHYQKVLNAYNASYGAVKNGVSARQIDKIARDIIQQDGTKFIHSLGHGVGVNIHERPYLSPKGDKKLSDGMVFTIEPGSYVDGRFGIRIEDTCYLQNGKINNFYTCDRQLKIIE